MISDTIRSLSGIWSAWAIGALADGLLALSIAGVLWMLFRKVIPPRWGMWLFLLVMAKSLVPTPVSMPGWTSRRLAVQDTVIGREESLRMKDERPALPARDARTSGGLLSLGTKEWLFLTWCLVVTAGFCLLGLRAWRTWRLVGEARPLAVVELEGDADWAGRLDLGEIGLLESDDLSAPAAWGGGRACVILPTGLADKLSIPQLRWTLAHEISHLRHGDWAVALAQAACGLLCFFNPAAWIASIAASALRERACDEAAVRLTGIPPQESANGFLRLVEWSQVSGSFKGAVMPGLSLEGRTARWRLRRLLQGVGPMRQSSAVTAACLLAIVLLLPSFRGNFIGEIPAQGEIQRLQAQVTDLEGRLQQKSDRETRMEINGRRAAEREAADAGVYNSEERNAIETIYQEARGKTTSAEKERIYAVLFSKYPRSNRTGCAKLFSARLATGAVREQRLREVIADSSGCFYLDGTSVGGVARLLLARDLLAQGRKGEAAGWLDELLRNYTGYLDHEGNPIEDAVNELRAEF